MLLSDDGGLIGRELLFEVSFPHRRGFESQDFERSGSCERGGGG